MADSPDKPSHFGKLFKRSLIAACFLIALVSGAISAGSSWILIDVANLEWSYSEDCERAISQGEYSGTLKECVADTFKSSHAGLFYETGGGKELFIIVAISFGILALIFMVIGIFSLRRHLRTMRSAQPGAASG